MSTIYETSLGYSDSNFTLHKYRDLANMPHFHDDYEIILVESGVAKISVGGIIFRLCKAQAVFINSSEIHSISSSANSMIYVLKLSKHYFSALIDNKNFSPRTLNNEYFTSELIYKIKSELTLMDKYSDTIITNMISITLSHMLRKEITYDGNGSSNSKSGSDTEFLLRVSDLMSRNYNTVTFKEAANHMNYSEPYFSKHFKQLFEMTFTEYLNILRIGNAIKMIKKGDLSVTSISMNCGFNTVRHFNRTFKELTGYSPTNLPQDYVFTYRIRSFGIDPTLKCTELIE